MLRKFYYNFNLKHAIFIGILIGFISGIIKRYFPTINFLIIFAVPYLIIGWLCILPIMYPEDFQNRKLHRLYIVSILCTFIGAILFEIIFRSKLL